MEIAKIKVSGATASAEKESKITAGMVGVTVRMVCRQSPCWENTALSWNDEAHMADIAKMIILILALLLILFVRIPGTV